MSLGLRERLWFSSTRDPKPVVDCRHDSNASSPADAAAVEDPGDVEIRRLRHELTEAEKDIRMLRMLLKAKW